MDRKEFIKKTIGLGIASSFLPFFSRNGSSQSSSQKLEETPMNENERFKQAWLKSLMTNMDAQLEEEQRIKLMESCGRDCARRGAIQMATSCKGDLEKFAKTLGKFVGIRIEANTVHIEYDKCYCHLVREGPETLSNTWCNCSVGWIKEMFETVVERPVEVQLLQSIKRGDPVCKFIVRL